MYDWARHPQPPSVMRNAAKDKLYGGVQSCAPPKLLDMKSGARDQKRGYGETLELGVWDADGLSDGVAELDGVSDGDGVLDRVPDALGIDAPARSSSLKYHTSIAPPSAGLLRQLE